MVKKISNVLWKLAALSGAVAAFSREGLTPLGIVALCCTALCVVLDLVEVFHHE